MGCIVFVPCGASTENHRVAISAFAEQQKRMKFTAANVSESEGEESAGNNDLSSTFPKIYLQLFSLVVVVLCMRGMPRPSLPLFPNCAFRSGSPATRLLSLSANSNWVMFCARFTPSTNQRRSSILPDGSITSL